MRVKVTVWVTMGRCYGTLITASFLLLTAVTRAHATIYIDAPFAERVYDSVAYFEFKDTKWPYAEGGDMLIGPLTILTATSFDQFFLEYQESQEEVKPANMNDTVNSSSSSISEPPSSEPQSAVAPRYDDPNCEYEMTTPPAFLMLEYGSSIHSSSVDNIRHVAGWLEADFVVLVVNPNTTWQDKIRFWWSHKFPGIPRGKLNELGRAITPQGQCSFLAVGPKEGADMLDLLEQYQSWNLSSSQEFYFGIDSISVMNGSAFGVRFAFYFLAIFLFWRWTKLMDRRDRLARNNGEELVKYTSEDLGMGEVQTSTTEHDCCVCLEIMPRGEKVRLLPCRHAFHHDCINGWFEQNKFSCPMCKMDLKKHLEERRKASAELEAMTAPTRKSTWQRLWPWGRRINILNDDHLMSDQGAQEESEEGDLELTEESGVIV